MEVNVHQAVMPGIPQHRGHYCQVLHTPGALALLTLAERLCMQSSRILFHLVSIMWLKSSPRYRHKAFQSYGSPHWAKMPGTGEGGSYSPPPHPPQKCDHAHHAHAHAQAQAKA